MRPARAWPGTSPRSRACARWTRARSRKADGRSQPLAAVEDLGDVEAPPTNDRRNGVSTCACVRFAKPRKGIVKLTKSSSINPQDTGLEPVATPPCWASKTAVSPNLTSTGECLHLVLDSTGLSRESCHQQGVAPIRVCNLLKSCASAVHNLWRTCQLQKNPFWPPRPRAGLGQCGRRLRWPLRLNALLIHGKIWRCSDRCLSFPT